jgi:hypothetical protein
MGNRFRTYINGRKVRGVRRQIVGHVVVGQRELASYCALRAQYDIECGGLGIRAATHAFQVFAISSPRYCKMFKAVIPKGFLQIADNHRSCEQTVTVVHSLDRAPRSTSYSVLGGLRFDFNLNWTYNNPCRACTVCMGSGHLGLPNRQKCDRCVTYQMEYTGTCF